MSRTVPFGTFTTRKDLHAQGARMARRQTGLLINTVYENVPKKGRPRDWSRNEKHAYASITRIVPLHQYGQGS
jgi:hypothetical protein